MKVASPPLIGSLFLPTLGLAVFSLAVGYWISRKKNGNTSNDAININNSESPSELAVPVDNTSTTQKILIKKKKKHQCACGSNETSKFDKPPSQIKIMYGTLMGKSKVCGISRTDLKRNII